MKNTVKSIVAVLGLSLALTACGSKPAETTEVQDTVVVAPDTTVVADTVVTPTDTAAVAK